MSVFVTVTVFLLVLVVTTHRVVGRAWARVLDSGVEAQLSPSSDFFDAGGHSLLLAKLTSVLAEETGVTLSIPDIIESPTLDGMARLVEEESVGAAALAIQPTVVPGLKAVVSSVDGEDPIVLQNGSDGVKRITATAPADAARAREPRALPFADLAAEARRLDPTIYPAGTRKIG